MALHRLIERDYAAEFPITASAPGGGPYEQFVVWTDGLKRPSQTWTVVAAYMIVAYHRIYGLCKNYKEIFNRPYYQYVDPLFDGNHTEEEIAQRLPDTIQQLLTPAFIKKFNQGQHLGFQAWVANNTNAWRPQAPMRLYHAKGDEACPYEVAELTSNFMKSLGANVELIDVGNYHHVEAFVYALEKIKEWFDSL
jgi:hypothetical protein